MRLSNAVTINFDLPDNGLKVIRGPNGSGKSLFLKSIAFLMKSEFDQFDFNGKSISQWNPEVYRSQVLYVPSSTFNLEMSVDEYLEYPRKLAVYGQKKWSGESVGLCRKFELSGKLGILSMGQRQILNIIRAIGLDARILLLDEPTSHLDPDMAHIAENLIMQWKESTKGSLVVISHEQMLASRLGTTSTLFSDLVLSAKSSQ
ncbi:MAG TPA: ABC transporter ATP-binding protein [Bacteriovoracaceae bacterium]|nr:ABC transporter ATP-binding protein [Bacteriovoracaceae bacterium]